MAEGKKSTPDQIYKIMTIYATNHNCSDTARQLGMNIRTVTKIVNANIVKPEFAELVAAKKLEFAEQASSIIDKAMMLLDKRFNTALNQETELEEIVDLIGSNEKLTEKQKMRLISKIQALQINNTAEIAKTVGILFDKRALAKGESTENTQMRIVVDYNDE